MEYVTDASSLTYNFTDDIGNVTVTPTPSSKLTGPQWWFGQIFPWIIIVFGTFGNFCVVFILSLQKYGKISTCYYMRALAWSDNFVMILLFVRWLSRVPGSPLQMNTAFCVGYFFSVRFGFGMSAWTLMFMTVDRYISVKWPLKAKELCTLKRARISLFVIAIVHVVSHLPYFWRYYDANPNTLSGKCPFDLPTDFVTAYKYIRMLLFDRVLPWVLTLTFTIAMSIELYLDVKRSRECLGDQIKRKQQLSRRVTAMSLIVSWVFFFLTFPTSIDYGIRVAGEFSPGNKLSVPPFLYDLWVYLLYLNSAMNFWLYVCASHKFREDFKIMVLGLLGREVPRKGPRGSLSRKSGETSGIGHISPSHAIHSPTDSSNRSPLNTTTNNSGIAEFQNPEFTHL